MTRVVVVDDQAVVREGLVLLLGLLPGIEVVGSAGDGEAALRLVGAERPDVVLMDLRMPRMDGVEATGRIRTAYPETQVVVLTTYSDDDSVFAALRAGARGFLTKDAEADDIASAVATVMRGDAQLDPTVQRRLLDTMSPPPTTPPPPTQATPPQAPAPRSPVPAASDPEAIETGSGTAASSPAPAPTRGSDTAAGRETGATAGRGYGATAGQESMDADGSGPGDAAERGSGPAAGRVSGPSAGRVSGAVGGRGYRGGAGAGQGSTVVDGRGSGSAAERESTSADGRRSGVAGGRESGVAGGRGGRGAAAWGGGAPDGLTPRESEVLALIAEGLSNAEIASRLYITEATVKTHINNLFAKAHLRDRAQAVTYAYRHGLVNPG
ncbi:response regulator [Nonomuraea sp. MTCD27]|uniref:response regulator n=1 Tax=Nonomuraea sp. MTCD27 TaxID=1676747 RepID=UPI0035C10CC1